MLWVYNVQDPISRHDSCPRSVLALSTGTLAGIITHFSQTGVSINPHNMFAFWWTIEHI